MQIRSIRSQMNIPPSKLVPLLVQGPANDSILVQLCEQEASLKFLARLESVTAIADAEAPRSAMAPYSGLKLHIPLAGLIDIDAERARLAKEIARVEGEIRKSESKLASETFVQNAPIAVVGQERARLVDWSAQRDALREQSRRLGGD
jgi:valyl-tRNA synthetase